MTTRDPVPGLLALAEAALVRAPGRTVFHARQALTIAPATAGAMALLAAAGFQPLRWATRAAVVAGDAALLRNLAGILLRHGRPTAATEAARRALALDPAADAAWTDHGLAAMQSLAHDTAGRALRRAARLVPGAAVAWSRLALLGCYDPPAAPPDPLTGFAAASPCSERPRRRAGGGRLRVGFLSPDFRGHSVAYFLEPLLAAHDRDAVELFAYAEVARPDRTTRRLRALTDHWRDTTALDDAALARAVVADDIDLLIDLGGHFMDSRLAVLSRRPAPRQATWLGYNASTGLSAVDYRLTDHWLTPPGHTEPFTERLWRLDRLAHCWRPPAEAPPVGTLGPRPVFASFNTLPKLNRDTIRLWSAALRAVPAATLLLKARGLDDPGIRRRLGYAFRAWGVDPARIAVLPWIDATRDHLALYAHVDVALDPYPYHGTTTTCEALWMGVPVISRQGGRMVARVGASLLAQAGLANCAVADEEQFAAQAAALIGDRAGLAVLRRELRPRLAASALRDEAGFARAMEAAYRAMMAEPLA